MGPSAKTCELYLSALQHVVESGGVLDEDTLASLVQACREDGLSPSRITAMHAQLCADLAWAQDPAVLLMLFRLLERVIEEVQLDVRRITHDLRNSMQVVLGSLSLLERDVRRNAGERALEIIERSQGYAQELSRRIERVAHGYSDLR